ncbi:MAG TPA: GAF and ANTAR domain-containing protein [Actinomycetota bacterium]|jgi:signal transduction protein with GAF and PtsI domain
MPIDPEALAASIERLQELGLGDDGLEQALRRVVDETDRLFGVDGAGLMLLATDDHLRYVAASDERGRLLEKIQEQVGEGPCLVAFDVREPVATGDAPRDQRWAAFGRLVGEHGIHAVLGVPVDLEGTTIGTLNVYQVRPHPWDRSEQDAILAYARVAGTMLGTAFRAEAKDVLAGHLQNALDRRVLIEQAKGILMERHGVDARTAFERLRRRARSRQEQLTDLARRVVDGEPLPPR